MENRDGGKIDLMVVHQKCIEVDCWFSETKYEWQQYAEHSMETSYVVDKRMGVKRWRKDNVYSAASIYPPSKITAHHIAQATLKAVDEANKKWQIVKPQNKTKSNKRKVKKRKR